MLEAVLQSFARSRRVVAAHTGRTRPARIAVATGFLLLGASCASWIVRIPDAQLRLELSEGTLGLTLFGLSAGGFLAMPLSARLIPRFGSRAVSTVATLCMAALIAGPALAPTPLLLALVLLALGAATSVAAVSLNTQAAGIERRMRRPIMAGQHALFSLGGLLGAGLGGLVADAGVGMLAHLAIAGLVIAAVALAITPFFLPKERPAAPERLGPAAPRGGLLLLGAIAFCVLFGEGAVADWSTIYMRDAAGAGPALAAAGYAAFSLTMAAGRFAGDALTLRFGPVALVRAGGATAAAGIALAVTQSHPWLAIAGFGLVGAGFSSVFPTVVAAAGRTAGASASSAIAVVSSLGYAGLLAGPPLIGLASEGVSLRVGVGLIGIAGLLVAALAPAADGEGFLARARSSGDLARPAPGST